MLRARYPAAEFYEGVQQRFVHLPGDSGGYNAAQAFGGTGVNGAIIAAPFCSVITQLPPRVTTPVFTILWSAHRSTRQYYRRVDCRMGCARIEGMVRRFMPDDLDMLRPR